MGRLIVALSILYSCLSFAKPAYQIDLIVFAHPNQNEKITVEMPFLPMNAHAILLKSDPNKSAQLYSLLPPSYSSLRNEYYLLSRKSNYQILGHYSWRQPAKNQSPVALPLIEHNGWQMQGTFDVKQNNYYAFHAELQISPPTTPKSSFTLLQKQRLKDDVIYYLDNPHIGMLVKIHQV